MIINILQALKFINHFYEIKKASPNIYAYFDIILIL